jgi:uncharacterized protein (TIGR00251 family)
VNYRETAGGARLDVRVMPRSPRAGIAGERDGRLLVRVAAPPVEGAANAAVIAVLAAALDLPRRDVRIVSGGAGRNKVVEIAGLDAATVRGRLSAILG